MFLANIHFTTQILFYIYVYYIIVQYSLFVQLYSTSYNNLYTKYDEPFKAYETFIIHQILQKR